MESSSILAENRTRSVAMHFDMSTMAGRHLVFAYASVIVIQGGYFLWLVRNWFALNRSEQKKQRS